MKSIYLFNLKCHQISITACFTTITTRGRAIIVDCRVNTRTSIVYGNNRVYTFNTYSQPMSQKTLAQLNMTLYNLHIHYLSIPLYTIRCENAFRGTGCMQKVYLLCRKSIIQTFCIVNRLSTQLLYSVESLYTMQKVYILLQTVYILCRKYTSMQKVYILCIESLYIMQKVYILCRKSIYYAESLNTMYNVESLHNMWNV